MKPCKQLVGTRWFDRITFFWNWKFCVEFRSFKIFLFLMFFWMPFYRNKCHFRKNVIQSIDLVPGKLHITKLIGKYLFSANWKWKWLLCFIQFVLFIHFVFVSKKEIYFRLSEQPDCLEWFKRNYFCYSQVCSLASYIYFKTI